MDEQILWKSLQETTALDSFTCQWHLKTTLDLTMFTVSAFIFLYLIKYNLFKFYLSIC